MGFGETWSNLLDAVVAAGHPVTPSEKHFRTINGSGNGAFLAVVAVPGINKLRVIKTLNSSTPVASANGCRQPIRVRSQPGERFTDGTIP
jgi:hypothetical protein